MIKPLSFFGPFKSANRPVISGRYFSLFFAAFLMLAGIIAQAKPLVDYQVTTIEPAMIKSTSASLTYRIGSVGSQPVVAGLLSSTTNTVPDLSNSTVIHGGSNGFSQNTTYGNVLSGFTPSTTYYVRAYVITGGNTYYGQVYSFTTLSNNANISSLVINGVTLTPSFDTNVTEYTVNAPYNLPSPFTITCTLEQPGLATLDINGAKPASGATITISAPYIGSNLLYVRGIAQDVSVRKLYLINIIKDKGYQTLTFPALPALRIGLPDRATGVTNSVSANTAGITYESDNTSVATIVNGKIHAVAVGTANITAKHAGTDTHYPATVTRAIMVTLATNADLDNLTLSEGTLNPEFDATTLEYTATVGYGITSVDVIPAISDEQATVTVNGHALVAGKSAISLQVGNNAVDVEVTPFSGDKKTYKVVVKRTGSSEARLQSLGILGSRIQGFNGNIEEEIIADDMPMGTMYFIPVTMDPLATVTINGNTQTGTGIHMPYPLAEWQNYVHLVVTAADGVTTRTYIINIVAVPGSNLNNLAVQGKTLTPEFQSYVYQYDLTVNTGAITIKMDKDPASTVKINGSTVNGLSQAVALSLGSNTITIEVSRYQFSRTYTLTVTRMASPVPTLSYNAINQLTPGIPVLIEPVTTNIEPPYFSAAVDTVTADYDPGKITRDRAGNLYLYDKTTKAIYKLPAGGGDAVTVGPLYTALTGMATDREGNLYIADASLPGIQKIPATDGSPQSLGRFDSPIAVAVDSTDNIYVLTSGDKSLYKLAPDGSSQLAVLASFMPAPSDVEIDANGNIYVADGNYSALIKITPKGTLSFFSANPDNGNSKLTLDKGGNLYVVQGTGNIYRLNAAGDATLAATGFNNITDLITGDAGELFVADANTVKKLTPSGGYFIDKTLPAGLALNIVTGIINGTPTAVSDAKDYVITAYNAGGNVKATTNISVTNNTTLTNLVISEGTLDKAFNTDSLNYAAVFTNITTLDVTPTAASAAVTVTVNGNALTSGKATVPINIGANLITMDITAADGVTKTTYTLTVYNGPTETGLDGIGVYEKDPLAFDTAEGAFTAEMPAVQVYFMPQTVDGAAKVTLGESEYNGQGSYIEYYLAVGENVIPLVVTAANGLNKKTFYIKINGIASTDATLSYINTWPNEYNFNIIPDVYDYRDTVTASTQSIYIEPRAGSDYAQIHINGNEGSQEILLDEGTTVVTIIVTAQNNSTKTYTYTILRPPYSKNADLSNLAVQGNTVLTPAFQSDVTDYTFAVTTESIKMITQADPLATVTINDEQVVNGEPKLAVLKIGNNTFTIKVNAEDVAIDKTYTLNVIRTLPPAPTLSYNRTNIFGVNKPALIAPAAANIAAPGYLITADTLSLQPGMVRMTTDTAGNLYVADESDNAVYKVPVGGGSTETIISDCVARGLATDNAGNLYIADINKSAILKIPAGGGEPVPLGNFGSPGGVAADNAGNIFVIDWGDNKLYKMLADGSSQRLIGEFYYAIDVAVDLEGNAYVADYYTSDITKFPVDGSEKVAIHTNQNGIQTIGVDAADNIYFANGGGNIYKIPPGGGDEMIAATGFNSIIDFSTGKDGELFFMDINYQKTIQKITPAGGYFIKPALPAGLKLNDTTGIISGTPTIVSAAKNYTVTGYNSGGKTAAVVNIKVAPNDALLTNLVTNFSSKTLVPDFESNIYNYTLTSTGIATEIKFNPTASSSLAVITVNDETVASGTLSEAIALADAGNDIVIKVTAEGGAVTTYTVTNPPLPVINYGGPYSLVTNQDITPIEPSGTNIDTFGYGAEKYNVGSGFVGTSRMDFNSTGDIYLIDSYNYKLKKINAADSSIVVLRSSNNLDLVAVDAEDDLYVKDNNVLLKFTGGTGSPQTITIPGLPNNQFYSLKFDAANNMYLTSSTNKAVYKLPAGTTDTVRLATFTDNTSAPVLAPNGDIYVSTYKLVLNMPQYVINKIPAGGGSPFAVGPVFSSLGNFEVDAAGNIIITESTPGIVKMLHADDLTIADTLATGIANITGVKLDNKGNIYAGAIWGNSIIKLSPTGGYFARHLPAGLKLNSNTGIISGNPTVLSPATNYTINAFNTAGMAATTVQISVVKSADATLSNLTLSEGTFAPQFASATYSYTAVLNANTAIIRITPTVSNTGATIMLNDTATVSGQPSRDLQLAPGQNTFTLVVTAQDNSTKTYTVFITRKPSTNALLSSLLLDPNIYKNGVSGSNYKDYVATVSNTTSAIQIIPTTQDPGATVKVNDVVVVSGVASASIPLSVGVNTINTVVTAADGVTTKTYRVVITRKPATNALLSSLVLDPNIYKVGVTGANYRDYTASVSSSISNITVAAIPEDPEAIVKINGTVVSPGVPLSIVLDAGSTTTINTVVTASDGITTKTYNIVITRRPANNALLTSLVLDPNIYKTSVAGANYKDYTATVSSTTRAIKVTATTQDPGATVKINDVVVVSGVASAPIPLIVGTNTITTAVTAADGVTTKTYSIVITRKASSNALLSSLVLDPNIYKVGVSGLNYRDYTASVSNKISSIKITATTQDPEAMVKINTLVVSSGVASDAIPLEVGVNTINTEVTASDGTIKVYSVVITRAGTTTTPPPALVMNAIVTPEQQQRTTATEVTVSKAVSANGDGINDVLEITGIELFPDNTLQVMNSKGTLVTTITGYNNRSNAFDGRNKGGAQQPAGTYFYMLQYKDGKENKTKSGYFILKY